MTASLAVGVDIGGTKIAAGVVDAAGQIIDMERRPTPGEDVVLTEQVLVDVVHELAARRDVQAVGVGAAGWLSADRSTVLFSPHLAWRGTRLQAALAARIDAPVLVDNDANAAAWGEHRFGAGRDAQALVCVTLGTGIGGGLVLGGQLYRGAFGVAGEFGHAAIVPDGRLCACGQRGCWETYVSGDALATAARELATTAPMDASGLLAGADGSWSDLTGELVTAAAAAGDPAALQICGVVGDWLGRGLANVAAILDPDVFVIAGGASSAGALLLEPARATFRQRLPGGDHRPVADIRVAALGPNAGLIGVADLARRQFSR